ncbi:arylesterase [Sphingobium sp. DEHP117]|uniref:arylesterase n=1 Tax=Sphingobium sp. DEHP117 TaxID=2993436 RepID=UPI0027D53287|nr:GDSL-type esterase/lipase family protein [Sphingobium sp. DEHP117]MDQ4420302.1 arylesterase [Sphingobium sp. DEHP117]
MCLPVWNNAKKSWVSYGVLLALVQLVTACGAADEQGDGPSQKVGNGQATTNRAAGNVSAPAAGDALVVVFGDSLFAGYQLGRDEGLAPALERNLRALGTPAHVFNAGVSGDTSAAGLMRLGFVLDGLPKKPDLVIIGFGGNDMLRGLSPQATRDNLTAMLEELKRRGIAAMLAGMIAAPNMGDDYAKAFNPIYADLSRRYGAPLYPFILDGVIGDPKLLLADGIHPNPQGVDKMANGLAPLAARALKE